MLRAIRAQLCSAAYSFCSGARAKRRGAYQLLSTNDKLDLRAAQRTFDGAYVRTALGQMYFSLTIMRIFQREFFSIGIACCVLALCLILIAVMRYELSLRCENEFLEAVLQVRGGGAQAQESADAPDEPRSAQPRQSDSVALLPRFHTAGHVVLLTVLVTLAVDIAIIILLTRM